MGLVEVTVRLPAAIDPELSSQLTERYQPVEAVVITSAEESVPAMREAVARSAADLLSEVLTENDVLGLTCSHTVAAATQALSHLAPCRVVQLSGTLAGPEIEAGSVESVRRAAHVGGGKAFPIYAPMVLADAATARSLAQQPTIRRVIEEFGAVSVAMVAVGCWAPGLSTIWDSAAPEELSQLASGGTVGEIAGRMFDAAGAAVPSALDDRVLGVGLEQLRRIPRVIGLAHDARRSRAVQAALTGGLVDFLVCDAGLARALLAEDQADAEPVSRPRSAADVLVEVDQT
jgi:DNA-binding transcriptional regulator LsrR (DeoR family)